MWTPQVEPFFAAKSATYQNLADTGVVHLSGKMKRSSRVSPQSRNIASTTFDERLRNKKKKKAICFTFTEFQKQSSSTAEKAPC